MVGLVSQIPAVFAAILAAALQGATGGADEAARAAPVSRAAPAPALTLRQLVGQHMVFAYDGLVPPPALRRRIARGEAAGVILFGRNVQSAAQVLAVVRDLQAIERPRGLRAPLIVMTDQEGGPVRRIPGAPERAAADVATAGQARADGLAAARTLRSAGVNMDLAPVSDVGRPGSALVGERRIYSMSPERVATLAGAFAAGLREGGVRATAKHYPGFGAATVNTDNAPARVSASLATLRSVDARPFAALIAGGVDAVMVSTAVYPALTARPAAFSAAWVTDELRGRLGFQGVAMTDDLGTPAVQAFGPIASRTVLAVSAGVDLPLFSSTYRDSARAAEGLLAAAKRGDVQRAALRTQARRVLALRKKLPR
jgi:beta-N-acetylhexosaminidase